MIDTYPIRAVLTQKGRLFTLYIPIAYLFNIDISYALLYTVYIETAEIDERPFMKIIINTNSMIPIYEQIMDEIKKMIATEELKSGDALPSVRSLSKDLKISALTVKKAYDNLEQEGFTTTVHGKGTYVTGSNVELLAEEQKREIERELDLVVKKAKRYGLSNEELCQLLELLLED